MATMILVGLLLSLSSQAAERVLWLDWPHGWDYRVVSGADSVVRVQGRQLETAQRLSITLLRIRSDQFLATESLKDLVRRLSENGTISPAAVTPFHVGRGYYFIRREMAEGKPWLIAEGAMTDSNFLIVFALVDESGDQYSFTEVLGTIDQMKILSTD